MPIVGIRRGVASYSAGRIINPNTARDQMIGSIMLEESALDPTAGRYLLKNLAGVIERTPTFTPTGVCD